MTRGKRPQGQVPAGTSVRLHCCPSHTCYHLTPLPATASGAPGHRGGMPGSGGTGTCLQPLWTPQEWTWGLADNWFQTEQDKAPWNPLTLAPRTFPGCQSRLLLPVCWRAVFWPIQLPCSPVLGLSVVTSRPVLPGPVPVLHPVPASWATPRVTLRGTQQPQCPQRPQRPEGVPTPARRPRSQGTTQAFLCDHWLSGLQEPEVDGDLVSGRGAHANVSGVPMCVLPGKQVCT